MNSKNILIVAGEPSGDLYASNLVKDLKEINPNLRFFGLGGALSKEAGVDVLFDIAKLALIGLLEVWKNIFTVGHVYKAVLRRVDAEKPDLAILVDYPGFNLRLAKELKARSIPVVYYISPQVWAWGRDRINIIKRCVTKILVFFKFEEELYKTCGVDAEFIGHPLLETVKVSSGRNEILKKYNLVEGKRIVSLLPGSRTNEVKMLLPLMTEASEIIGKKLEGVQFVVAKHPDLPDRLYDEVIEVSPVDIRIAAGDVYNILSVSDFALVASGTATLETAIIGTPMLITYKVSLVTYIAYKFVVTVRFLGIVNIIADKMIAPEFLQYDATAENLAECVLTYLSDDKRRASMIEGLRLVKSSLGTPGGRERAARAVSRLL